MSQAWVPTASCARMRWNALECAGVGHSLGTNFRTYWITWSARPTSDCGSVSPKASAIFFNRLREPPGITGTQKRIKGLSGGSPNSIRPADPYCRGAPRYSGSPHGCPGAPRELTAPVIRRAPAAVKTMSTAAAALRVALAAASKRSVRSARKTCPWHGAKFDIRTGAGRGPPAGQAVKSYPVRVTGADIEIEV